MGQFAGTMDETTVATMPRRDSSEIPFDIHLVADLVINITLPVEVQQEMEAGIDRMHQLSLVVHVIGDEVVTAWIYEDQWHSATFLAMEVWIRPKCG